MVWVDKELIVWLELASADGKIIDAAVHVEATLAISVIHYEATNGIVEADDGAIVGAIKDDEVTIVFKEDENLEKSSNEDLRLIDGKIHGEFRGVREIQILILLRSFFNVGINLFCSISFFIKEVRESFRRKIFMLDSNVVFIHGKRKNTIL
ncbi:conserved hypothetical protein [Ricinus communis]|uniref:Uncharacterized protein n=1 Tax=Ricinus communis TaxID=3988 RepID=B9SNL6_RICCO|nr:conserved hypothetical protein [Ricinus communis]